MSKDTLQLPKTAFSMKASLQTKEPEILKKWEKNKIFDKLRKKEWFVAPLTSSIIGSTVDTFLFFSISFYATGIPWVTLAFGDLAVKLFIALAMLIPFRLIIYKIKDFSESSVSEIKN